MITTSPPSTQEVQWIFGLHEDAVRAFDQGNIEAARKALTEAFSATNRLLRQASGPEVFYQEGSRLVPLSTVPLQFSDTRSAVFRQSEGTHETASMIKNDRVDDALKQRLQGCLPPQQTARDFLSSPPPTGGSTELPIHPFCLQIPQTATINQFAFLALYNLALSTLVSVLMANHAGGSTSSGGRRPSIQSAAKLWELVYDFQWRPHLNLTTCHALAILVNLGHAQCCAGNEPGGRKCFENIISAIQILECRKQHVPKRDFFLYSAY